MPSEWVIISGNKNVLEAQLIAVNITPWLPEDINKPLIFTDNYSNLFSLLR
jgi:hypothetical protein